MKSKLLVALLFLTSFIESKGFEVEFKGSVFAINIKLQQLNEESEFKAVKEMADVLKNIADHSFDFTIESLGEPTLNKENSQKWDIPFLVKAKLNSNFYNYKNYFINTLKAISMSEEEAYNYINLKKSIYTIMFRNENKIIDTILQTKNLGNLINHFLSKTQNELVLTPGFKLNSNTDENQSFLISRKIFENAADSMSSNTGRKITHEKFVNLFIDDMMKFGDSIRLTLVGKDIKLYENIFLRNIKSSILIQDLMFYFTHSLQNFIIDEGITKRNYENLTPLIKKSFDGFYPVILSNNDNTKYYYSMLSDINYDPNYHFLKNFKLEKYINYRMFGKNTAPKIYESNFSVTENNYKFPSKDKDRAKIANVNFSSGFVSNKKSIPSEYFTPIEYLTRNIKSIILKSSFNIVIQLNKLTDDNGFSAIYKIIDLKSLDDINNIKAYNIYPNK
jgi:hypothetical protein